MVRMDLTIEEASAAGAAGATSDELFRLGMLYSTACVAPDYVAAHKWFNLAAMRGNVQAFRLRREVADQMTETEIAAAQRAARSWIESQHIRGCGMAAAAA